MINKPEFTMSGDAVEATYFERFTFFFQKYKKMVGITGDGPSHRDQGNQQPDREAEENYDSSHGGVEDVPVE